MPPEEKPIGAPETAPETQTEPAGPKLKTQVTFRMTTDEAGYFARYKKAIEGRKGRSMTDKELIFFAMKAIFN